MYETLSRLQKSEERVAGPGLGELPHPRGRAGLAGAAPRERDVLPRGPGERGKRSQFLPKSAGAENVLTLAVSVLAVNAWAVNGAFHALYSFTKCLIQSTYCRKVFIY